VHLGGAELPADEALHGEDGVLRIGEGLPLGDLADEALPLGGEADDRRRRPRALLVGYDLGRSALHHRDAGVRRTQVDPDHLTHAVPRSRGLTSAWTSSTASVNFVRPGGRGDPDQRRAQQPVAVRIALAVNLHHRSFRDARDRLVGEGLVTLGVERLAQRVLELHALRFQDRQELAARQLDPLAQRGVAAFGPQRAIEVVEHGAERLQHVGDGVRSRVFTLALHALAEVLELRPAAEQLLLELISLAAQRLQLLPGGGGKTLDVDAGEAGLLGRGGTGRVRGRHGGRGGLRRRHRRSAFVLAVMSRHGRSSCRVRAKVRATWSTRAMTRAYYILVDPITPRPHEASSWPVELGVSR